MIDQKEFNFVSQFSHFGWGLAVVFATAALVAGPYYVVIAGIWTIYSAIKEFWYDYKYETPEIRGSSLEDFCFQAGGAFVAVFILLLAGK